MHDLFVFALDTTMSDEDVKESIVTFIAATTLSAHPIALTVAGYDDDDRYLWEIPEVKMLLRKWYALAKAAEAPLHRVEELGRCLLAWSIDRCEITQADNGMFRFQITQPI